MENEKSGCSFSVIHHINIENQIEADLKVLFVIKGSLKVTIGESSYILKEEDVIAINQFTSYSLKEQTSSITAICSYLPNTSKVLQSDVTLFSCNSALDNSKSYKDIRDIFIALVYEYTWQKHYDSIYTTSLLLSLLDVLIQSYMVTSSSVNLDQDDYRIKKLLLYVNSHFQQDINLTSLSSSMYASTSTLSRLFKKQTGVYFADYVNLIRCRYAADQLINTEHNVTKIAFDAGFSNSSMFNKVFKKLYDTTPLAFRESHINKKTDSVDITQTDLRESIKQTPLFVNNQTGFINIKIDPEKDSKTNNPRIWNKIINIGSFASLTQSNVQAHCLYLHQTLGFEYVRIWSAFSTNMMFNDGVSRQYNYDKINQVLDFLVNNNIKPFIDFGCKPDAILSSASSIYYKNENIVFASKELWEKAVKDFFNHIVKRYGKDIVSQWMVEFSHDSRHFKRNFYYKDEDYNFCEIFKFFYQTAKSIIPEISVCGVSSIINDDEISFMEYALYVKDNDCIPDYFTFLMLPYVTVKDESGKLVRQITQEDNFEQEQLLLAASILDKAGIKNKKLIVSEINNSISNRNYLNDSLWRSAFFIRKMESLWDHTMAVSILMGSDWNASYYDSIGLATGCIGLLTKDTLRKPAYFALELLNQLYDQVVYKSKWCIATYSEEKGYSIILNNYKHFAKSYYHKEEDISLNSNMSYIFSDTDKATINIELNACTNESYTVKCSRLNSNHGSILNEWSKMNYETSLNTSDIDYLKGICVPELSISSIKVNNNIINLAFELDYNEVMLIKIYHE